MSTHLKNVAALLLAAICAFGAPAAWSQDDFDLPPDAEKLPRFMSIPLPRYARRPNTNTEALKNIEGMRLLIEQYYKDKKYEDAQPIYAKYIAAMEQIGVSDPMLIDAWRNYGDLLRRLHKDAEASEAEARAQAILARNKLKGTAFGLKGYVLGMSLDDFSNLPGPKPEDPADAGLTVKPVCSCDAGQTVEVVNSDVDRAAKIIQCGHWLVKGKDLTGAPYVMTVGGIRCTPDFKFLNDQGVYRLYEISISFYSSNFEDMQKALTAKYGAPESETVDKVRTPMGNIFRMKHLTWDNGMSKIILSNADAKSFEKSSLLYQHRQLHLVYAQRLKDMAGTPLEHAKDDL